MLQEGKRFSQTDNADIDEYFKAYIEKYAANLTAEELILFENQLAKTRSEIIIIPKEFLNKIQSFMFHENTELLVNEISCFYDSPYFVNLNKNDQDNLRIKFESLIQIRDITIEGLIDIISKERIATRMSPGDRMVWSGAVAQLTDEQRSKLIDAGLIGIGFVASGVGATAVGIVALLKVIFW